MKKLLFAITAILMISVIAFASTRNAKKAGLCIAITPQGVCLQQTVQGTNYCSAHTVQAPAPCVCHQPSVYDRDLSCGRPCAAGSGMCSYHANPNNPD